MGGKVIFFSFYLCPHLKYNLTPNPMFYDFAAFIAALFMTGLYLILLNIFKDQFWVVTCIFLLLLLIWGAMLIAFAILNDLISISHFLF